MGLGDVSTQVSENAKAYWRLYILIHSAATSPLEAIGAAETEMRTATAKTMAALNFMLDECGVEGVDKVGCFFWRFESQSFTAFIHVPISFVAIIQLQLLV